MKRGNVASMTSFLPFSFLILFATKTTRALPPSLQRPAATEARGLPSYTRTSLEDWGGRTQSRQSTKRKKKQVPTKKAHFSRKGETAPVTKWWNAGARPHFNYWYFRASKTTFTVSERPWSSIVTTCIVTHVRNIYINSIFHEREARQEQSSVLRQRKGVCKSHATSPMRSERPWRVLCLWLAVDKRNPALAQKKRKRTVTMNKHCHEREKHVQSWKGKRKREKRAQIKMQRACAAFIIADLST